MPSAVAYAGRLSWRLARNQPSSQAEIKSPFTRRSISARTGCRRTSTPPGTGTTTSGASVEGADSWGVGSNSIRTIRSLGYMWAATASPNADVDTRTAPFIWRSKS